MAGFDHRCPYCDREMEVYQAWESRDYTAGFLLECSWCKRNVQVDVRSEPIFETSKPCCAMCSRAEVGSNPHYCDTCHKKLIELSAHNERVYHNG